MPPAQPPLRSDPAADPILAAIDRHLAARAACVGLSDAVDKEGFEEAHDRRMEALEAVEEIKPTTIPGLFTLARHLDTMLNEDLRGQSVEPTMHGHAFVALINACLGLADTHAHSPALAAEHDLSAVSVRHLARFYDHLQGLAHIASMACNAPMGWDGKRRHHSPLGPILEAEADRLDELVGQVAAEIRARTPVGESERDDRLATLVKRQLAVSSSIEDFATTAEINRAWGR